MMAEQAKENVWPTLTEAHGLEHDKPASRATAEEPSDWEIVADDGFRKESEEEVEVVMRRPNPRILRHCASSPDLRFLDGVLEAVAETEEEHSLHEEDSDSHVLVHGPPSVISMSSSMGTAAQIPSFRDAILMQHLKKEAEEEKPAKEEITPIRKSQKKFRPKIVVTPIRRCVRSTGDLPSLAEEEEVLGETDAMEYYQRKSMGAAGWVNGMKERPDESKRKSIIMYKKDLQRRQQAGRKS